MSLNSISEPILIELFDGERGETVQVTVVGQSQYRIESVPFSVEGFRVGDIVTASSENDKCMSEDGKCVLLAGEVVVRSGRKLLRAPEFDMSDWIGAGESAITALQKMGCQVFTEHDPMTIDIPSEVSIDSVTAFLDENTVPWYRVA